MNFKEIHDYVKSIHLTPEMLLEKLGPEDAATILQDLGILPKEGET